VFIGLIFLEFKSNIGFWYCQRSHGEFGIFMQGYDQDRSDGRLDACFEISVRFL
jgi:hypothetical protein